MLWSDRDIAQLAPDPGALERARPLVNTRRWRSAGAVDQLLWAEFPTPGNPYFVAAQMTEIPAFYCTCPVKRKPCKHVLALLLLASRGDDVFVAGQPPPEWVTAWLNRRQRKREKTGPAIAQAAATDKRLAGMLAGVADLLLWLEQLVGQGLASAEAHREDWERFAARLVDAKLSGIARRLRLISACIGAEDWPKAVLQELADIYLFARAFSQYEQLPADMQQELLGMAGVNLRKEDLAGSDSAVNDRWMVLGCRQYAEEQLQVRRTWLLGEQSGRFALLLDFAWGSNDFEQLWQTGAILDAALVYYPGVFPLRAVIQTFQYSDKPFVLPKGCKHAEHLYDQYALALTANPLLSTFPALLDEVTPVFQEGRRLLIDSRQRYIPLATSTAGYWSLLAISGGHPLSVFGEWNGAALLPLGAVAGSRVLAL